MLSEYLVSRINILLGTFHAHNESERSEFVEAAASVNKTLKPLIKKHDRSHCLSKAKSFRNHIPSGSSIAFTHGYTLGTMIFELQVYKKFDASLDAEIFLKKIYDVIDSVDSRKANHEVSPIEHLNNRLVQALELYASLSKSQQELFRERSLDPLNNIDSMLGQYDAKEMFEIANGLMKNVTQRQSKAYREGYKLGIIVFELNVHSRKLNNPEARRLLDAIPVELNKLDAPDSLSKKISPKDVEPPEDERIDQLSQFIEIFIMPVFLDLDSFGQEQFRKGVANVLTEFTQLPDRIGPNQRIKLALDKQRSYLEITDVESHVTEVYVSNMSKILGAMLSELLVYETWGRNEYAHKKIEAIKNRLWP